MVKLIVGHYETMHEEEFNLVELRREQGKYNMYFLYLDLANGKFYVTWDATRGYVCDNLLDANKHFEESVVYWGENG